MSDPFFTKTNCDRCNAILKSRQMSWFTDECLCSDCHSKEKELRTALEKAGEDVSDLEGCGYLPNVPTEV